MPSDFVILSWLADAEAAGTLDLDVVEDTASKSTASRSQTSSKWTRTPIPKKTLRDLSMLNKPIKYVSSCSRLPPETFPHWQALGGICCDVKTIPAGVALQPKNEFIQEHMIDHDADRKGVELEYEALLEIHADARQCADNSSDEAQWNTKVHDRILSCALRPFKPRFKSVNMSVSLNKSLYLSNPCSELQKSPFLTSSHSTTTTPLTPRFLASPSIYSLPLVPLSNPPFIPSFCNNPRSSYP